MSSKNTNKELVHFLSILLILTIGFFQFAFFSHGVLGNDSPAYIHLAEQLEQTGKLHVYDTNLKEYFLQTNETREASYLTPHYHFKLSQFSTGLVSPETQIGYPLILAIFYALFGYIGLFIADILILLGILLLTQLFCEKVFPKKGLYIGLVAVFLIGTSSFFWEQAIFDPITEFASLYFVLLTFITILLNPTNKKSLLALTTLFFFLSFIIRLTNVLYLLAFGIIILIYFIRHSKKWIQKSIITGLFGIFLLSAFFMSNHVQNDIHTIDSEGLGNINSKHLSAFSLQNFYDNPGKYQRGYGSFFWYSDLVTKNILGPLLFVLLLFGIIFVLKKENFVYTSAVIYCALATFFIYSFWINPYNRYILNTIYFVLILLSASIVYIACIPKNKFTRAAVAVILAIILISSTLAQTTDNLILQNKDLAFNYVSQEEYLILKNATKDFTEKDVLLFTESIHGQSEYFDLLGPFSVYKEPRKYANVFNTILKSNNLTVTYISDKPLGCENQTIVQTRKTYYLCEDQS